MSRIILVFVFLAATTASNGLPEVSGQRSDSGQSLRQLFVLHRHGAKVPGAEFLQEDDKNKWTDYVGQLTNEGKTSLFQFGASIRERYGNFIGQDYDAQRFFIGSTAMDRTLMSAQCLTLGLFPPRGTRVWNKRIPWQPVPVYPLDFSLSGSLDSTMACISGAMTSVCQNLDAYFSESNKKTMNTLLNFIFGPASTGSSLNCDQFSALLTDLDDLSTMIWYNLDLPAQLRGQEDELEDLKGAFMKSIFSANTTCGHSLAGSVLQNFLRKISDLETGKSNYSAVVFSEHDAHVMAVVTALSDISLNRSPNFGAHLIVEVREPALNSQKQPEVKMWYAPEAEAPSQQITFKVNHRDTLSLADLKTVLATF